MSFKKVLALFISVVLVAAVFVTAASAVEYRVGGTKGNTAISDSYNASIYHEYLKQIPLTGDGRLDTVAIALSQIGYQEGNDNTQFAGTYPGSQNFTEFNRNFGDWGSGYGNGSAGQYAWCAAFVAFSLYQARTHNYGKMNDWCRDHTDDANYIWREISCINWLNQLDRHGYFKKSQEYGGSYKPKTGDLIFFGESSTKSNHIGIVVYCEGNTVYTIEGNTSQAAGLNANGGGVYFKSYALSHSKIRGYGVLPYKTNSEALTPNYSGKTFTTGIYVNTDYEANGQVIRTYTDAACSKAGRDIKENSLFEILEFVSPTIVKVKYYQTTNTAFGAKTGYVKLAEITGKVAQAVNYGGVYVEETPVDPPVGGDPVTPNPPVGGDPVTPDPPVNDPNNTFVEITKGNQYKAHMVFDYLIDGVSKGVDTKSFEILTTSKLSISGYAGFEQNIVNSGYYFDDDKENITWNSSFLSAADDATKAVAGDKAMCFTINAKMSKVPAGEHTVNYVLKLGDGTFVIVDSLTFVSSDPVTEQPPVETPTTPDPAPTKSGCGSTIGGVSAIALAMAASVAFIAKKKRK